MVHAVFNIPENVERRVQVPPAYVRQTKRTHVGGLAKIGHKTPALSVSWKHLLGTRKTRHSVRSSFVRLRAVMRVRSAP